MMFQAANLRMLSIWLLCGTLPILVWDAANGEELASGGPTDELRKAGEFSEESIKEFSDFLEGSSRRSGRLPSPTKKVALPAAISITIWTEVPSDCPPRILLGFSAGKGEYFALAVDADGAPVIALRNRYGFMQICRAGVGAADLRDNRYHSLVANVNMASGLIRLYVDGAPEAASVVSFWRPQAVERVFISPVENCFKIGVTSAPFGPRIVARELTESEIALLKLSSFKCFDRDEYAALSFGAEQIAAVLEKTLLELIPKGTIRKKTIHGRTTVHLD
jgi:hypothetical protein